MRKSTLAAVLTFVVLLTGCSDIAETLGFGRNPPDEFAVVERPPLAIPPDFDLKPPRPGAPRPQEQNSAKQASIMMFGPNAKLANTHDRFSSLDVDATGNIGQTESEKILLEAAGAKQADPNIRELIDRDAAQKITSSVHLVDELLWWRKTESPATTVDASAEAERIREAKEKGEPLNKGATPVIERKKSGWLGS